jgi:hypothetical protein
MLSDMGTGTSRATSVVPFKQSVKKTKRQNCSVEVFPPAVKPEQPTILLAVQAGTPERPNLSVSEEVTPERWSKSPPRL